MGCRRQRVRRLHVQLRADDPRLQASPGRGRSRSAGGKRGHAAGPGAVHGRARRAARRSSRARRLGDLRQERHRRHDDLAHGRAGRDRTEQGSCRHRRVPRRPPWATLRHGRRRARGARELHYYTTTTLRASSARSTRQAPATSQRSSPRPSSTTRASTRRTWIPRSRAGCASCATSSARRW